ncbi:MAG: hypothetical protein HYV08_13615 [Deltaproteobacteria bacterium]|nr:hypothetical protein [Deltaproteobacteria bacterium]MBI3078185.1 hypothetical protein [Deltaproteobacteria bacterium]
MHFEQQVLIRAGADQVWTFLWEIEQLVACVPGCQEVKTLELQQRYEARVGEKVGPFRVEFPLLIEVLEAEAPKRIRARATGEERHLNSVLKIDLTASLQETEPGQTALDLAAEVEVLGKLGTLGLGVFRHKADQIFAAFANAIKARLDQAEPGSRP